MQHTGIIRRLDDLGRINIPKNIREQLRLHENDPLEMCIDGNNLVLRKYYPVGISKYFNMVKHTASIVGMKIGICDKDFYDIETNVKVENLSASQLFGMWDDDKKLIALLYCKNQCPNKEQFEQIATVANLIESLFREEMRSM